MIKAGDIVLCIKDYKIYDMNFSASEDDLLEVVDLLTEKFMYPVIVKDTKGTRINMSLNEFQEHFLTPAQCRDNQIDSILEDE